jgi:hypothetical protein
VSIFVALIGVPPFLRGTVLLELAAAQLVVYINMKSFIELLCYGRRLISSS